MGVKDLQFSDAENQKMSVEAKDDLYHAYFCALGMKPDTLQRENAKSKFPYVTRPDLYNWLLEQILANPVGSS